MRVDLVTPANGEVLSVEKAKAFARVTHAAEDALFGDWILAAVGWSQEWSRRQFLEAEFELIGDSFACLARETGGSAASGVILLHPGPLVEVLSVKYLDIEGVEQTLTPSTEYAVRIPKGPMAVAGSILPGPELSNLEWPATQDETLDAVRIRFRAGYGTEAAKVPAEILSGLAAGVADRAVNRELSKWRDVIAGELVGFRL